MNSTSERFIKRYSLALLLSSIGWPLSHASSMTAEQLVISIEDQILAQWFELGQYPDATNKVVISGLPQGYKSPGCKSSLLVKPSKTLRLGRNGIQVSCPHRSSWSLMLNADIQVWREVVILRDHISRGDQIRRSSVGLQQRDIGTLPRGYYSNISKVIGNISKRSLKAGTAISPSMINPPIIVQRGQAITLRAQRLGFSVDMKGLALKKGRKGDKIKVKNKSSHKVLHGTIVHADLILVD